METDSIPCFNTSHVTLYPTSGWDLTSPVTFQYISCYSLSLCWCAVLRITFGFNTSHVTLYRKGWRDFQWFVKVSIHLMLLFIDGVLTAFVAVFVFQYISCYSLSSGRCMSLALPAVSIHLMLLFILLATLQVGMLNGVSIHLMLLFIG